MSVHKCVCMCVWTTERDKMCVCISVRMCVCKRERYIKYMCMCVHVHVCVCVKTIYKMCVYICAYVCVPVFVCVCVKKRHIKCLGLFNMQQLFSMIPTQGSRSFASWLSWIKITMFIKYRICFFFTIWRNYRITF